MHCGERGFEFEYLVCGRLGIGVGPTGKRKHLSNVRHVGIANLLVLFFAVVGLVWQADSAVIQVHQVAVWVTRVVVNV